MIRLSSVTVPAMSICWEVFPHPLSRTAIAAATRAAGGVFAFPMIGYQRLNRVLAVGLGEDSDIGDNEL